MWYRLLTAADFSSLHACFPEAFADYEVDMRRRPRQTMGIKYRMLIMTRSLPLPVLTRSNMTCDF